jgi:A/G-specific adenine glycosylase
MNTAHARIQLVQPEHRIVWTARSGDILPKKLVILRSFFVTYARSCRRSFPWRELEIEPFKLLVAELLLIQTKAECVANVWPILVKMYPTPERLAQARIQTLRRILRPLGLQNQRAHALRELARALVVRFHGHLPWSIPDLLSLPHVGLYVACAVACFKHGQRVPIVDANVLRVLGRITGTEVGKELRRSPEIWHTAWGILPKDNFALHNYGVLDFSAGVCKARGPLCTICPLSNVCVYAGNRNAREVSKKSEGTP